MSLNERRRQRLADRRSGPLIQEAATDLGILTDWVGSLVIPMMNLRGTPHFVDDPSPADPYEHGVDIYFTKMALHSLDQVAALDAAGATLDDDLFAETRSDDAEFALNVDLTPGELLAGVAAAEATAIPSLVPESDVGLADAVSWTWVVVSDLCDRITTYLRPLTVHEWQDFANLCGYVLALAPTGAAEVGADHAAQTEPGTSDTCPSWTPDSSC